MEVDKVKWLRAKAKQCSDLLTEAEPLAEEIDDFISKFPDKTLDVLLQRGGMFIAELAVLVLPEKVFRIHAARFLNDCATTLEEMENKK